MQLRKILYQKDEFHTNYKNDRNSLSALMKKRKQAYYDKSFERSRNNNKNTWKVITSLISLRTVASIVPTILSLDNGDTITNLYDIANTFNNHFAAIAETIEKCIKYSHKRFSDYLSNKSSSVIFLQPTDKEKIANIIAFLNSNNNSGPNRISYRILFLLKNKISKQIADLFNLSFMTGVFPSLLTTAKVVPNFNKDLELDNSNYFPISLGTLLYKRYFP